MTTNETSGDAVAPVLDLAALESRCLGNLALVERVLRKFESQLELDLNLLEQALNTGDLEVFASVAHRIKGMSANVEAKPLSSCAARAEQFAREKLIEPLADCLTRMRADCSRLADAARTG